MIFIASTLSDLDDYDSGCCNAEQALLGGPQYVIRNKYPRLTNMCLTCCGAVHFKFFQARTKVRCYCHEVDSICIKPYLIDMNVLIVWKDHQHFIFSSWYNTSSEVFLRHQCRAYSPLRSTHNTIFLAASASYPLNLSIHNKIWGRIRLLMSYYLLQAHHLGLTSANFVTYNLNSTISLGLIF